MKKICLVLTVTVFLSFATAQGQKISPVEEKQALTEKSFALFQQGKLDDAIKLAAKVVELEKTSSQTDTTSYANATLNLARMKRDNFLRLREKAGNRSSTPRERSEFREKANENASDAEELFLEALKLNETGGRSQTAQTADIKGDLAWLTYNYFPIDDLKSAKRAGARARIDEAEKLFTESMGLNERIRGKDADETLFLVLASGNFYLKFDNFEKALPFYERYIQTVEKKRGQNHVDLVNALSPHAQILFASFQDQESTSVLKRIEQITGQKENLPMGKLNLGLRSKDAVAHQASVSIILAEKNKAFQMKLRMAGGSLNRSDFEASRPRATYTQVKVIVGESGKIIEASAETTDSKLRDRAEQEVSKWTVRPFSYNGLTKKTRGYLTYAESP